MVVGIEVILIFEQEEGVIDIYDETADFDKMGYDEDYREEIYGNAIRKALETLPKDLCKKIIDTDIADYWQMNA